MNIKNIISNVYLKSGVVASMALSSSAFAADEPVTNGNYLDGLIKQIDVGPIITGIVAVAGTIMGVAVVVMGIKKVARMLNAF
ncbi:TPA: hypothetical protein KEY68_001886 [Providencia rettgeri]|uniref:hypothetical protein n=1 Tax=Morganellaceae TaxID=1903414 RepID=UPI000DF9BC11|nr:MULTISPECIES: hypothetical protein [Morganellaceae]EKW4661117.1 hypothetical protein [Proteus mirabilis]ELB1685038.1 hypothetical protein [Proteus mirabilis]SUC18006.1 Uncharacterised protein [Proteus mirabilis]SUC22088.1 Uncharacterised protein [Proteus mirabilis]SUC22101.1 Uncharacterised protein [Proteus mirabilis]